MKQPKQFWLKSTDHWSDEDMDLGIETNSPRLALRRMVDYALDIRGILTDQKQVTVQVLQRKSELHENVLFASIMVTGD